MDFHFLELFLSENPNFLDDEILVPIEHVHNLDRLEQHRRWVHLICIHAISRDARRDHEHNREEMGNVGKLILHNK